MDALASNKTEVQIVTLGIGQEVFAVPVDAVIEILDMRPLFRIPDAPRHLAGLINGRGRGVPVIDLRLKLGLPSAAANENTRILVLEVPVAGRLLTLGLIADRVFEVLSLGRDEIEDAPDIGSRWRSDYIEGVGRRDGSFVVIFNLARLFASDDLALLATAGEAASA